MILPATLANRTSPIRNDATVKPIAQTSARRIAFDQFWFTSIPLVLGKGIDEWPPVPAVASCERAQRLQASLMAEQTPFARPVAITLRREIRQRGPWRFPHWTLRNVHVDAGAGDGDNPLVVEAGTGIREYVWRDQWLRLRPDAAESYWYNLTSSQPSLFVACRPGDSLELEPFLVTADGGEAGTLMEVDESVLSIALPEELAPWIEQWVLTHYRPGPRKEFRPKRFRERSERL